MTEFADPQPMSPPAPPPARPDISVIVPHLNDIDGLQQCLALLAGQIVPGRSVEIIVADNGSDCGAAALEAAIAGHARLVIAPERGAGPARNAGVAVASAPVLAFTDSDCQPDRHWLAAGLAALEHTDIVGGRMVVLAPASRRRNGVEAFEAVFGFDNEAYVRDKGFTVTANLFVRAADFGRVGGFVVGKSEDQEWCDRARALGLRLAYCPAAIVAHPPRDSWSGLHRKWRRIMDESYAMVIERPYGRLRWLAKSLAMPLSALVHLPRMLGAPTLDGRERLAGAIVLLRIRIFRMIYGIGQALSGGIVPGSPPVMQFRNGM